MYPKENIRIGGNVEILVLDMFGRPLERHVTKNLVVKSGRNAIRDLMLTSFGAIAATPNYIAVGSDATATSDSQTALVAEVFRKGGPLSKKQANDSGLTLQLVIDTTEANGSGSQPLREAGVFIYAAGAPMLARATFATITKTSAISVIINWQFTLAAS